MSKKVQVSLRRSLEEDDDENEGAIAKLSTPYIIFQRGEAMKITRIAVLLFVLISSLLAVPSVDATLIPSGDGTVYDTVLKVHWLADANLAGASTPEGQLLVWEFSQSFPAANITPGGSM